MFPNGTADVILVGTVGNLTLKYAAVRNTTVHMKLFRHLSPIDVCEAGK